MTAPSVAYGQLAPMLIVFGVAVVGVLVEAFLPRKLRYRAQLSLSLAGLFVADLGAAGHPAASRRHRQLGGGRCG